MDAEHANVVARWRVAPLDGRLGALVVGAGLGLCTAGTLLEPRARAGVELSWWAQLLALFFWAGACGTAVGVLRRRRVALLAALLSALSFAVAAALVPSATPEGVTLAWFGELGCALVFLAIVLRAMVVSGRPAPERVPAPAELRRRALA